MSRDYYEFLCPVKLVVGHKALEHIPFELSVRGSSRPLVLTDKGVAGAGLIDIVSEALKESEISIVDVFDDIPPDAPLNTVLEITKLYRSKECDSLLAIGGGSVIDAAKGVNILVSEDSDDLQEFSGANSLTRPLRPMFVIPTTSGTGSEVTFVAMIADTENNVKLPFASHFLMPDVAVLDPRMTKTLPPRFTASTAMDAMTHAVESYICMAKNPISDAYAVAAIRKVSENLIHVLDKPDDIDARLELAQASTMGGIAFSNSMVGLAHSLGHAAGALCHAAHGDLMSLFLPYVLEYNLESAGEMIGELLLPLAGAEVYAKTPADERAEAVIKHIRDLRDVLHERCGVPRTLQETGKVKKEDLEAIADLALDDGSIIFNPAEVDRDEALAVLEKAW